MKNLALGLLVLAACTKAGPPPATLDIQPARLTIEGKPALEVTARGDVIDPQHIVLGTLHADGTFRTQGNVISRIDASGNVSFTGEAETLQIGADGTTTSKGKVALKISDDGAVQIAEGPAQVRFDGPPAARRAMAFAYLSASEN